MTQKVQIQSATYFVHPIRSTERGEGCNCLPLRGHLVIELPLLKIMILNNMVITNHINMTQIVKFSLCREGVPRAIIVILLSARALSRICHG